MALSKPDKKTILKELEEKGKHKGNLTAKEIFEAMGEVDFYPEEFEKLYSSLGAAGIEVIDDFDENPFDNLESELAAHGESGFSESGDEESNHLKLYFKEVARLPLLSSDEETDLVMKVKEGDADAKRRLAEANLRLGISIARLYLGRDMPFIDLLQEGNLGIIEAVDNYDHTKGFKFSTYAAWWIRHCIMRAFEDRTRVYCRMPLTIVEKIHKIERASTYLLHINGYEPTAEELSEYTNIPADEIRCIMSDAYCRSLECPIDE